MTAGKYSALKPIPKALELKRTSPPPAALPSTLRSFKDLTVDELKANPELAGALRRLRAQVVDSSNAAIGDSSGIVKASTITDIKAVLTPEIVAGDPRLRKELKSLKSRTEVLSTLKAARTLSAVGERNHASGPPHAAGIETVSSIGPGWLGPHRTMESYRRPTGPGKR